ncbi:MAG: sulfatase, partial [bacterium]
EETGFNYITSDERDELSGVCADYLTEERDKPFFMVASFINPHDICYMAIRDFGESDFDQLILENGEVELATLDKALQLPEGVDEKEFFAEYCPPLPDNFEPQENEPEAVQKLLQIRKFRKKARENYSEKDWRRHRWAYCKLTERVDSQIEELLKAVKENGLMEDTVIIFTSDHGDMDSSHRLEHKTVFYEEASRIPLIVYDPESERKGIIEEHLVSNGLDLLPTLCDYAGISPSGKVPGKSLKSLVQGKESDSWREYVPVQNEVGYMIVTGRYKYMLFEEGENREQLMDLKKDPGEMKNFASHPDYCKVLEKHRQLFKKEWPEKSDLLW